MHPFTRELVNTQDAGMHRAQRDATLTSGRSLLVVSQGQRRLECQPSPVVSLFVPHICAPSAPGVVGLPYTVSTHRDVLSQCIGFAET